MSETARHSGLYSIVRDSGRLIDEVLIAIKTGKSRASDEERKKLAILLNDVGAHPSEGFVPKWLELVLSKNEFRYLDTLSEIGSSLLDEPVAPGVVEKLEDLAQTLERERATLMEKLRG